MSSRTDRTGLGSIMLNDHPEAPAMTEQFPTYWNQKALDFITFERFAQHQKWGKQEHHDLYWLGILMEEVGEVSKEIIEGQPLTTIHDELVQVAAVACAWLEWVQERITNIPPVH